MPEPDGPMMATRAPWRMCRDTLATAVTGSPLTYTLVTFVSRNVDRLASTDKWWPTFGFRSGTFVTP